MSSEKLHLLAESEKNRLSFWQKLSFGLGGTPFQFASNAIAFYCQIFFLDIALVPPSSLSIIIFSARFFDGFMDPVYGFWVNKSQSNGVKLKTWCLITLPCLITLYLPFWYVPEGFSVAEKTCYYTALYVGIQTLLTCYHIPYTSLTMYLSKSGAERDSATAYRMTLEAASIVVVLVLQGSIYHYYAETHLKSHDDCSAEDDSSVDYETIRVQREAFVFAAIAVSASMLITFLVFYIGTTERQDLIKESDGSKEDGLYSTLYKVISFYPYKILMLSFFCTSSALQLVQNNLALYLTYAFDQKDNYPMLLVVLMLACCGSVPLWHLFQKPYGKVVTVYAGALFLIPPIAVLGLLPEKTDLLVIALLSGFAGVGVGNIFYAPWAMLPDVIDAYLVETQIEASALFFGIFVFFTKLGVGVSLLISSLILEFAGYVNGACQQPDSVSNALRLLCTPLPCLLIIFSVLLITRYPINQETAMNNKAIINERAATMATGDTKLVDPNTTSIE